MSGKRLREIPTRLNQLSPQTLQSIIYAVTQNNVDATLPLQVLVDYILGNIPAPPSGIPEAPQDSQVYGRRNAAWVVIQDGQGNPLVDLSGFDTDDLAEGTVNLYLSSALKTKLEALPADAVADAPNNGTFYARRNAGWQALPVIEAPNDGNFYARRNGAWQAYNPGAVGVTGFENAYNFSGDIIANSYTVDTNEGPNFYSEVNGDLEIILPSAPGLGSTYTGVVELLLTDTATITISGSYIFTGTFDGDFPITAGSNIIMVIRYSANRGKWEVSVTTSYEAPASSAYVDYDIDSQTAGQSAAGIAKLWRPADPSPVIAGTSPNKHILFGDGVVSLPNWQSAYIVAAGETNHADILMEFETSTVDGTPRAGILVCGQWIPTSGELGYLGTLHNTTGQRVYRHPDSFDFVETFRSSGSFTTNTRYRQRLRVTPNGSQLDIKYRIWWNGAVNAWDEPSAWSVETSVTPSSTLPAQGFIGFGGFLPRMRIYKYRYGLNGILVPNFS